jgi:flagellar protein FliO/FliZ
MDVIAGSQMLRFVVALVFVLSLMAGLALALRFIRDKYHLAPAGKKRLRIMESLQIDSRRRAVILRRDGREHLVILGASSETVIESGIESAENSGE